MAEVRVDTSRRRCDPGVGTDTVSPCSGTSYTLRRAKGFRRRLQPQSCTYVPTGGKGRGGAFIESEEPREGNGVEKPTVPRCALNVVEPRRFKVCWRENCMSPKGTSPVRSAACLGLMVNASKRGQGNVEGQCREKREQP